ncbi:MAG: ribonuclease Y [Acidobacteria bacterium]|nr:ribonuclease Y [Acidobacteriota bacterium]
MTTEFIIGVGGGLVTCAGAYAAWFRSRKKIEAQTIGRAEELAKRTVSEAEKDAERLRKDAQVEAKEKFYALKQDFDRQAQERRNELNGIERRLAQREEHLERKLAEVDERLKELAGRDRNIKAREKTIEDCERKLKGMIADQQRQLEQIAGLTSEDAKRVLLKSLESDARRDGALMVKRIEEEAKLKAENDAKKIVCMAIQRCAVDHTTETTVSVVDLPREDLKGRIIGREGRNIRALEQATGVDLIVDDTPEAIILSGFDPVRREIAKMAIEKLISDGRIHPSRIEEVVEKVKKELDERMRREGESVALELGQGDIPPEMLYLLGKLKFRTSYGQNMLQHSKEVAFLAGFMATELGLSPRIALRAGLFHDIGKAVDRETEGTHTELSVELCRKHGESKEVLDAIEAHHFDADFVSLESILVQVADAISAARPGARREMLENYVKRVRKLEEIADSFEGVAKAYALQAGREVRIIVESNKISDEQSIWLSKDIAKKIQSEMQYPGQIKVTVIRETRAIDYAK